MRRNVLLVSLCFLCLAGAAGLNALWFMKGTEPLAHDAEIEDAVTQAGIVPEPYIIHREARNVTPNTILPGPEVEGPMVFVPLPKRPTQQEASRSIRFAKPVALSVRELYSRQGRIELQHIKGPEKGPRCFVAGFTRELSCFALARSAFRRFLRGRTLVCDMADGVTLNSKTYSPATCYLTGDDIALWALTYGWARPTDDAPDAYKEAAKQAEKAKTGLWLSRFGEKS
jgi:endonuclease YncB( thermonuclease family)